ncbi:SRPBCC family protein [Streptomyces nojiriensis]|uniref:SRPBCC family protein n=1 Tax=Streptomyces nojiriensis TaxID=66374 RepID=UPI0036DF76B8
MDRHQQAWIPEGTGGDVGVADITTAPVQEDALNATTDVSAIGRWSPNASDVTFGQGAGPRVGAWFSGRNHMVGKQWTTRSQVVRADPGTAFAFVVGGAETTLLSLAQWIVETPAG